MKKLILEPYEIKANMKVLCSYIESMTECYKNVRERVYWYVDDEDLDTESWRGSKHKMDICYRLIAEGMISVQESIIGDIDTLLGCIGDEYLDEDELETQIKNLQAQCGEHEKRLKDLRVLGFLFGGRYVYDAIENCQEMIDNLKEQIAELEKKLKFLIEVNNSTAGLFQEAMSTLSTVQNAISDGGVNVRDGNGFDGDLGWLTELNAIEGLEEIDDFESYLIKQGFPEGYIKYLKILHEEYPEWKFEAVITGIDYKEFAEFQISSVLKCGDYDDKPNYCLADDFKGEKDDKYHVAKPEAIFFFMNPYSMLQLGTGNYTNAMQFLKADQELPKDYSDKVVSVILQGKDPAVIEAIQNADSCVNPIFMAAVYLGENGPYGKIYNGNNDTNADASVDNDNIKRVYNIFNIGADSGEDDAVQYAYEAGWFSLEECMRGSEELFQAYVDRGQDTLYALDWDYMSYMNGDEENLKQYATLVNDAELKAINMCKRGKEIFDLHHDFTFTIPVYENIIPYGDEEFGALPDPNHVAYILEEYLK